MLTGTNLTYTKAYNFRIVFETIRLNGPISRADVARRTNLTAQTVSNIVNRLLERNFILEGSKLQKQRGAPSTNLFVNPDGAYSVGIDFNRDHLTGILVDLAGNVKTKYFYEVDSPYPEEAVKLIADTAHQLTDNRTVKESHFCGVGIGLPGPLEINEKNEVSNFINPKAFPHWNNVPIGEMIKKQVNTSVFIENNASAATIGELWYGAGKNKSNFLYVFLGAGLGGGLVVNGNIYEGSNRNAGELGFFPYFAEKSPLSFSDEPHVGEHFNLYHLYKWLKENGVNANRPEDLGSLFDDKSPAFMEWLDKGKSYLTPVLLFAEYFVDMETIILGGRLPSSIIENMVNSLPNLMSKARNEMKTTGPEILVGTAGPDAAALGAATLPMFDLFSAQTEILMKTTKNGNGAT